MLGVFICVVGAIVATFLYSCCVVAGRSDDISEEMNKNS